MSLDRSNPVFFVSVVDPAENEEVLEDDAYDVISMKYVDSETSADKLTLVVDNFKLNHFDNPIWKQGHRLRISWGYPGRMAPTRECVIRSVKGFARLTIEASGRAVLMNSNTVSRTFENMTNSEIVTQIARENGFGSNAIDIQETTERFEHKVQANQSDAQFIRRLAHQEGFEFFLDWDGFHFHERRLSQRPMRTITWYTDQDLCEITNINIKSDITARPGRTRVVGRNPETREDDESSTDNDSDTNRPTTGSRTVIRPNVNTLELPGLASTAQQNAQSRTTRRSGGSTQQPTAEQEASESSTREAASEVSGNVLGGNTQTTPGNPETAQQTSRSRFRRAQQLAVEASITMVGDPSLLAKSTINLQGVGQRLSGNYYVKEISHELGANGYSMTLEVLKDATGEYARRALRRNRGQNNGLPDVGQPRSRGQQNRESEDDSERNAARPDYVVSAEDLSLTRATHNRGRDSRTGGGRPAPPTATEAAQRERGG